MKDTQDTNKIKYVRAQLKYIRMLSEEYIRLLSIYVTDLRKANYFLFILQLYSSHDPIFSFQEKNVLLKMVHGKFMR